MERRIFLQAAAAAATLSQTSRSTPHEWTIDDIQHRMTRHQHSSQALTHAYLQRIEELNHRGPALRAVIEVNPDALARAHQLDAERLHKGPRSPLHGIPVLLKDNIDTGDRMQTTAGSLALVGAPTPKDALLVDRLRKAGAVILGKTNLSEWANFRGEHSTSGWSGRGGQTRNPYALDRNPCGSSSGSGVAVSANLCAIAIGTETDGSIVCPSSMNGIVGIKPTVGLISRTGIIPISSSQDTAGPMARTVRDAAIALGIVAEGKPMDYAEACDPAGLRGARIGIARVFVGHGLDRVIGDAIDVMRKAGATVVDPVEIAPFDKLGDAELTVMQYEFKAGLNSYLSSRGGRIRSLADCIAFNRRHAAEELTYFGQELMEQSEQKGPLTHKAYTEALKECRRMRKEGIDATVAKHKLDAIAATTTGPAHLTDLVNGDHIESNTSSPAAVAGYPHITVPAAHIFGLPVGISFFGTAWSEAKLIRIAYAFEQVTLGRRPPQFLPTANLRA
jgi:amidase